MRQLQIQVPKGQSQKVQEILKDFQSINTSVISTREDGKETELILTYISNSKVEEFVSRMQDMPDFHLSMFPEDVIALKPPPENAPDEIIDIEPRSPLEIYLSGLQSISSLKSLIGFSIAGGIVTWVSLYTNSSFLLIAAMLITPFASPAINTAIATARGDTGILRKTISHYMIVLAVTILISSLLTLIFKVKTPTQLMVFLSNISAASALLPLAAGVAGGIQQSTSEQTSLISVAAVGVLVAATLAPPTGIIGISLVIGEWDLLKSSVFLILLQLSVINLSASLTFMSYRVKPSGIKYEQGSRKAMITALAISGLILVGLLIWQFSNTPYLLQASLSKEAQDEIETLLRNNHMVYPVEISTRYTRSKVPIQNTLFAEVYVQKRPDINSPSEDIKGNLTRQIQQLLMQKKYNAVPLVNLTVLETPDLTDRGGTP